MSVAEIGNGGDEDREAQEGHGTVSLSSRMFGGVVMLFSSPCLVLLTGVVYFSPATLKPLFFLCPSLFTRIPFPSKRESLEQTGKYDALEWNGGL